MDSEWQLYRVNMIYDDDYGAPNLIRIFNHREVAFRTYEHINNLVYESYLTF